MANIKVPADMIMVQPDGTVIEIHIRNKPPANEYNKQAEIFKQTTQTCPYCNKIGKCQARSNNSSNSNGVL